MSAPIPQREIYRIVDANLNRAREGLRVVEEIARFVLEQKPLQRKTKQLRHKLASLFSSFARSQRKGSLAAQAACAIDRLSLIELGRDAPSDVGKDSATRSEASRGAILDFVQANFARIEESFRVLEEYTKLYSVDLASNLKAMRFDAYSLEREYIQSVHRATNILGLKRIGLYPIIDRQTIGESDPVKVAQQVLVPGVRIVQYRDKVSPAAELCAACAALRKVASQRKVIFIVNDRVDVALASDADGVHLGQDDFSVSGARKLLGSRKIIGKSTHSLAQSRQAAKEDVDYIAVGPIFSTTTKGGGRPLGPELIAKVKKVTDKPVVAIGGIHGQNLREVLENGADGAAVISAILKARSVRAAVTSLRNICIEGLKRDA